MIPQNKTQRLNLRISPDEAERLRKLESISKSASTTDVIRRALAVYEHLWNMKENGTEIIIRRADGDEAELFLL